MKLFKYSFLVFSLFILACQTDDESSTSNDGSGNGANFSENFGIQKSASFFGTVKDEDGNPLSGVEISIDSQIKITDDNGIFYLENASVNESFAYLKASKSGYFKGSRALVPSDGINNVSIILLTKSVTSTVSSGTNAIVSLPNGATVELDGNYILADGSSYSGNVDVYMKFLDPVDEDLFSIMPGMLYGQDISGGESGLDTYGMVAVELESSNGESLNLANGSTAQLTFPVDTSLLSTAPGTIPLWFFDEEKGYWIEEGQATLVGNEYKGEVSHFTFWNCDDPFPVVNACIKVIDSNGNLMANTLVTIDAPNLATTNSGYTNIDGEVCGKIPANVSFTVNIIDPCGNVAASEVKGPFSSDTNFSITLTNAISNQTITGTLNDCNNLAVTNGYIIYRQGNNSRTTPVIGGSYSFSFLDCVSASNSFTIEGVDINSAQTSGEVTFTSTPPVTSISPLFTCDTISEYIEYSIDGIPMVLSTNDILDTTQVSNFPSAFVVSSTSPTTNGLQNFIIFYTPVTGIYTVSSGNTLIAIEDVFIDNNQPNALQTTLNYASTIGDYHSGTFGGTYTDSNTNTVRNLSGSFRVLRTQ